MKKKLWVLLVVILLAMPIFTYSDSNNCSSSGATVIYVNGVFTGESEAMTDKDLLKEYFKNIAKASDIDFLLGYNATHFNGLADLVDATVQAYGSKGLDYDLTNILRQVHGQLETRKILLVGHSQGTFYTNAAYNYLINNGVSENSIAVYNVATPADSVAGDGAYVTSSTDKVINSIVRKVTGLGMARRPLAANIDLTLSAPEEQNALGGHAFGDVYLAEAPDKIIADMQSELVGLKASGDAVGQSCFSAPTPKLSYYISDQVFATGTYYQTAYVFGKKAANATALAAKYAVTSTASAAYNAGAGILQAVSGVIKTQNPFPASLADAAKTQEPDNREADEPDETVHQSADQPEPEPESTPNASPQDDIDALVERLDLLRAQLASLQTPPANIPEDVKVPKTQEPPGIKIQQSLSANREAPSPAAVAPTPYSQPSGTSASTGAASIVYPALLISEVQAAGTSDAKEEFVELYNPTNLAVDLTGWYLQRKTATASEWASYATSTQFSGKSIPAKGYFLIARQGYYVALADISVDTALTDSNALAIKSPNGEVADKAGWGSAPDYEASPAQNPVVGRSIGRMFANGTQTDTNNNSSDFVDDTLTPKAQNVAYVAPVAATAAPATDTTAPAAAFTVAATQTALSFSVGFTLTDTGGSATASGIAGYTWRQSTDNATWTTGSYTALSGAPITYAGTQNLTGTDETTYYFQIKTKDMAGNESDWLPVTPAQTTVSLLKKVLINEVQIDSVAGVGGTDDDWVELYNPNNIQVSLNGWSIQKHAKSTPCGLSSSFYKKNFDSSAKIAAKSFYLIVGTNASAALLAKADMTVGWSLTDDNTLYVARSAEALASATDSSIVDKVGFGSQACYFETAAAATPTDGKSIERVKLGQDTDNNSTDFKISDEATPKGTFPKTTLADITDYAQVPGANSPGAPQYALQFSWSSSAGNVANYDVQYKLNSGAWTNWKTATTSTQDYFSAAYALLADNVYYFRARATDGDGNIGDWTDALTVDLQNPLVISEVAWAGTNAGLDDQWLELYNKGSVALDLSQYQIVSGTGSFDTMALSLTGTLAPGAYILLERHTDDNDVSDIASTQFFQDALGQSYIYLKTTGNGRYVDEFYMPSAGQDISSFTDGSGNLCSVERVSAWSFGSQSKNWRINGNSIKNGLDRNGNTICGTPGQQNSLQNLYTYYNYSFTQDLTLAQSHSPYVLEGSNVTVFSGSTLTVEPGTVIKFLGNKSGILVNGTLNAVGTAANPIVFTSYNDDTAGGDSANDGSATVASPGDWLSLYFAPGSGGDLEHVDVRYGGFAYGNQPISWGNAIWADRTTITLKDSMLQNNKNRGLMLTSSPSTVTGNQFKYHNQTSWPAGQDESKAIYVQGGSPTISTNTFDNDNYGVYMTYYDDSGNPVWATPTITGNTFSNGQYPIYIGEKSYPSLSGNQASSNTFNDSIFASDITQNMALTADLPYLITGVVTVSQGVTLTLSPGVILDFKNNSAGLKINGMLSAVGTGASRIGFRSYYYNQGANPGSWLGLSFGSTSTNSVIEYADFAYGGAYYGNSSSNDFGAAIKVDQSVLTLKNSTITNTYNKGLWLINSASVVDAISVSNIQTANATFDPKGVYIQGGSPSLKNSSFDNDYYGIFVDGYHDTVNNQDIAGTPDLGNPTGNTFSNITVADVHYAVFP